MIDAPTSTRSPSPRRRGCNPRSPSRRSSAASRCSSKSRWPPISLALPPCCAQAGALPAMIDFNFTEVPAWRKAKALLDDGAIGRLRHVAVTWQVENASTRLRLKNWKTSGGDGGGALGNFAQPLAALSRMVLRSDRRPVGAAVRLPDDPAFETNVALSLAFASGAAGSYAMSCASYLGSGHRLEFYGDDGTLVLANPTADYMRGFTVQPRAAASRQHSLPVAVEDDPLDRKFPATARIAPVVAARAPLPRCDRAAPARRRRALPKAIACRCCSTRCAARTTLAAGLTIEPAVHA